MPVVTVPAPLVWPVKDTGEALDYQIDWTAKLAGDTIQSSTVIIKPSSDSALTIKSQSNTTTVVTAWLQAGTLGVTYEIFNTIVTVGGRTFDQTVTLLMAAK